MGVYPETIDVLPAALTMCKGQAAGNAGSATGLSTMVVPGSRAQVNGELQRRVDAEAAASTHACRLGSWRRSGAAALPAGSVPSSTPLRGHSAAAGRDSEKAPLAAITRVLVMAVTSIMGTIFMRGPRTWLRRGSGDAALTAAQKHESPPIDFGPQDCIRLQRTNYGFCSLLYGAAKFAVGLSSLGVVNISGFFFADHLHPPPRVL